MAGFFGSLGGGRDQAGPTTRNNNKQAVVNGGGGDDERAGGGAGGNNLNLFSYGSEEIYHNNKGGFELWPTQYHPHHQQTLNYYAFGVDPSRRNNHNLGGEGNVSDDSSSGLRLNVLARQGSGAAAIGGSSGGGGMNCQDCGNQAKKDCPHLRCRTCCKSRGFQCQTHVKSTWVPAAKRRERQEQFSALQQQQQQLHQLPKRPREAAGGGEGGSSLACVRFPSNTSGLELAPFPAEVSSPAVFRCVRVSAMDDVEEQYAYQTAVNIGGHVFKGLLYDQGLDNYASTTTAGESSSGGQQEGGSGGGGGGHHHHNSNQQLNLITTTTTTTSPSANPPTATLLDPTVVFPTPLNAFVAGTQYFPPPR